MKQLNDLNKLTIAETNLHVKKKKKKTCVRLTGTPALSSRGLDATLASVFWAHSDVTALFARHLGDAAAAERKVAKTFLF